MPEANLAAFNLEGADHSRLEQRRRELVSIMTTQYRGYADPDVPIAILQELSAVTGALRAKSARPPKKAKSTKVAKAKPTVDDIANLF